jgi:hypothetical protein
MSLDRHPNPDGNYEPDCRWTTPKEQGRNMRTNVLIEIDGVTKTLPEWAEQFGQDRKVVHRRIKRGWNPKDAVTGRKA